MPFSNNQGIRIHYEIEGNGPPLVLQYGQYFPLDIWYELNYVSALKDHYQLILVDARGQGESDKPYDPEAYRIEPMVKDILSVLDNLGIEKMHYMGYSSGGYLGFGIAYYAPERCSSLILGGTAPYLNLNAQSTWNDEQIRMLEKQNTEDFVCGLEDFLKTQNLPPLSSRMRARMLTHDTRALIAWLRGDESLSVEDILGAIRVPCLFYCGENDGSYSKAQRAATRDSRGIFCWYSRWRPPGGRHVDQHLAALYPTNPE